MYVSEESVLFGAGELEREDLQESRLTSRAHTHTVITAGWACGHSHRRAGLVSATSEREQGRDCVFLSVSLSLVCGLVDFLFI